MKPEFAAQIVDGVEASQAAEFEKSVARMAKGSSPYDMAGVYTAQNVIDPRDTREYLKRMLHVHRLRPSGGIGKHLMRTWPTSY